MLYDNIVQGIFIERPNRFIAHVKINGVDEVCHVKNTGRLRELLHPGVIVYLETNDNPSRKTKYSLVAVKKGERLINIDSQAPNKVVHEWLKKGNLFPGATKIKPETTYGNSRLDFYVEIGERKIYIEVKGATLENDNIIQFPDAPTERGVKHINELCMAVEDGFEAYIFFVIQMKDVKYFTPNVENHKEFGEALRIASEKGVQILAYDCFVEENFLEIANPVEVRLDVTSHNYHLAKIVDPLLSWYDGHARILPWRESPSPYRVWISEIMLQQTRVEAVKPYFERFVQELPGVVDLAKIPEESLLKLWEGLGYYNRARNLQKAAKKIMEDFDGIFPSDFEDLLSLSGIGRYTAGAVSSIAFQKPVPAVDGNVLRVISRVMASDQDITKESVKTEMEKELLTIMPKHRPGDFNQALMEIGAMICVPNGMAKCEDCPLNSICRARALDIVMDLPKKTKKKPRSIEDKTILVIWCGDKVVIRKRKATGLLAGMFEFPNVEGHLSKEEALQTVREMSFSPMRIQNLESCKHIFTHKEWHMIGYVIKIDDLENTNEIVDGCILVDVQETQDKYPMPSAFQYYAKHMNILVGSEKVKSEFGISENK